LAAKKTNKLEGDITSIVEAARALAGSNTGALIVLSNRDNLKFYEEPGEPINAVVSKRLLLAIFNKQSPLHDGGGWLSTTTKLWQSEVSCPSQNARAYHHSLD